MTPPQSAAATEALHLDELFELAPTAIVLTELAPPRIIRVNREFTRMFGYTPAEAVGRSLRELIAPGELESAFAQNAQAIAAEGKIDLEVVRQRKDGTRLHVHLTAARVQLSSGATASYLSYRDISERIRAEDELRRQKAYLDELFDLAPAAIVLSTLEPRTLRVNKEFTRMFGYTSDEVAGQRLRNFIAPDELSPEALTDIPELLAGQKVEREAVRQRKDRTRFHAHITAARVSLPGEDDAAYLIYRDVSERKRADALLAGENRVLEMIAKGNSVSATLEALCRLLEEVFCGCVASIVLIGPDGRLRQVRTRVRAAWRFTRERQ
jgi:PAS domain S-box-containing protein